MEAREVVGEERLGLLQPVPLGGMVAEALVFATAEVPEIILVFPMLAEPGALREGGTVVVMVVQTQDRLVLSPLKTAVEQNHLVLAEVGVPEPGMGVLEAEVEAEAEAILATPAERVILVQQERPVRQTVRRLHRVLIIQFQ
jgi:hypothetical protein